MQTYRNARRTSGRHRSPRFGGESTYFHSLLLEMRRTRRLCRPYIPVVVRAFIVVFTAIELRPAASHWHGDLVPFLSRIGVLAGMVASILSIIFFDKRAFNFIVVGAVILKFAFNFQTRKPLSVHQLVADTCFHTTAILFSALVGRRRSISKPSALRASMLKNGFYMESLKGVRNVDVLEAGTRLQASILAIDYSLSQRVGSTGFFFTLPFAALFLAGYSTQRNGAILLMLLFGFALVNESSPVLGFNLTKTVSTFSGALLGLFVGPGLLTVDEWLATANQLYY